MRQLFVDGTCDSLDGRTFETFDPATAPCWTRSRPFEGDVDRRRWRTACYPETKQIYVNLA